MVQFEPLTCFFAGLQKIGIRERFEQVVECVYAIAVYGILFECRSENGAATITDDTQLLRIP